MKIKEEFKLDEIEPIPNWYVRSKPLLFISICILVFSLFSPILFTQISTGISFENASNIGDSIAIMSPFISLIGIVLTFIAFKIQYEANQNQIRIFNTELNNSKKIEKKRVNDLLEENIDMLIFDLDEFIKSLKQSIKLIEDFTTYKSDVIFDLKYIQRASPFLFKSIFQNDRKLVYQYLKTASIRNDSNKEWISKYSQLYSLIGAIPEYLDDIYKRSDSFILKKNNFLLSLQGEVLEVYQNIVFRYNRIYKEPQKSHLTDVYTEFIDEYKTIVEKPSLEKSNSDFIVIKGILSQLHRNLTELEQNPDLDFQNLLTKINKIVVGINSNVNDTMKFKDKLKSDIEQTFYGEKLVIENLETIKMWLDVTQNENTH